MQGRSAGLVVAVEELATALEWERQENRALRDLVEIPEGISAQEIVAQRQRQRDAEANA